MGSHFFPADPETANAAWHALEDVLDDLAGVAKSTTAPEAFYRLVLERIVPAMGVSGGAVWTATRAGQLRLECQFDLTQDAPDLHAQVLARHQSMVEDALRTGQPRIEGLAPSTPDASSVAATPDGWCLLQPFSIGAEAAGVIELVERGTPAPADRATYLQLLDAVAEVVNDFHRNRELGQLRLQAKERSQYDRFALRAHRSLDVAQTAFLIANEGRALVGCDRLSVLTVSGRSCKTIAVSGVDSHDRRSKLVRTLEQLVARLAAIGEPLWYGERAADMPDEVERPLQAYLDESHARVLAVVPLRGPPSDAEDDPGRVIGTVVAEQFQSSADDAALRERVSVVAEHGGTALANALAHSHLPLARVGRGLARLRWFVEARQFPKTITAAAIIAAVIVALALVPADFNIDARGEFQPQVRREVFASDDGVVSELLVEHSQTVEAHQPLLTLRKPELDLEIRRVAGEIQTAQRKLAAVQAERLTAARTNPENKRDAHQLTAEEEELKELLRGLADQLAILKQQREALVIRSPINGQALTWNITELLATRPVERGQSLLTVADVDGPWVVELRVPDDRTGHVLSAREASKPNLDVSFAPASEPGHEFEGRIADVALSTEVDETAGPTVLVTVAFDREDVTGLRPGATVLAKIHCGRRSLGYVWLHELFEFVQTHLRW